jgi:endoglucanase
VNQQSSAYIYHKKGANISDTTLPFHFNGNKLSKIVSPKKTLNQGRDYTVSGESITFKSAFISSVFTPTSQTGSLANLTLTFTRGTSLTVNMLQYTTPDLATTSSKLPATSADLLIPLTWSGQDRPAAIKAVKSDGTYLVDDWTQYLPELQKGRMTYGNQWDWNAQGVVLKAAAVEAVRQVAGSVQFVVFTVEFWPRVQGNAVNYTLTV